MSQYDFGTLDPLATSGDELAALLNDWRDALNSLHKGATRPAYATAGMVWVKEVSGSSWPVYMYDGTEDIQWGEFNPTANTFNAVVTFVKRTKLSGNLTIYVRGDGDDTNDGLSDVGGVSGTAGAFATLNKAMQTIARTYDLGQYNATIKMSNTHDQTAQFVLLPYVSGGGEVIVEGDTTTPSNTKINVSSAHAVIMQNSLPLGATCTFRFKKLQIQTTTSGDGIRADGPCVVVLDGVNWGACAGAHYRAMNNAVIRPISSYTVAGNAQSHRAVYNGGVIDSASITVTLSGTPAFSVGFVEADAGVVRSSSETFSGSATGPRAKLINGGGAITGGGGTSYFPGNAAIVGYGGWYDYMSIDTYYTISYGATITPSGANGANQKVTMTGSPTIAAPTNMPEGSWMTVLLVQDATGGRVPGFNSAYKFESTVAPAPTTSANAIDALIFQARGDGTFLSRYITNWS